MTRQWNHPGFALPRHAAATSEILPSQRRPLTKQQLHQKADANVAEAIALACLWEDKDGVPFGDYRSATFHIHPSKAVDVFVRFFTWPSGTAVMLLSSGAEDLPTRRWLPADLPERMKTLGFEMGPESGHYERELTIRSRRDVERTARLVVDIVHDAFNYRGLVPFDVRVASEGRATEDFVYTSFGPEEIVRIAAKLGYRARVVQANGQNDATATVELHKGKAAAEVTLSGPCEIPGQYTSGFLGSPSVSRAAMRGVRNALRRDRARLRADAWRVGVTLYFEGGVTAEWLALRIQAGMQLVSSTVPQRRAPRAGHPGRTR
jgi:hypothetical protein